MPDIEKRVTTGNLWSIIGTLVSTSAMIVALSVWGGRSAERLDVLEAAGLAAQARMSEHDQRIRSVENAAGRQDERLLQILDVVRKVEAQLEQRATGN